MSGKKYLDPVEYGAKALKYFEKGYNCSQSVVLAFADLIPIDKEILAGMSGSFGGGFGRMREVCGAISGMCIVYGALYGNVSPGDDVAKGKHYSAIQALGGEFKNRFGSMICRELLNKPMGNDSPNPTPRTPDFYKTRPCGEYVRQSGELLASYINEQC